MAPRVLLGPLVLLLLGGATCGPTPDPLDGGLSTDAGEDPGEDAGDGGAAADDGGAFADDGGALPDGGGPGDAGPDPLDAGHGDAGVADAGGPDAGSALDAGDDDGGPDPGDLDAGSVEDGGPGPVGDAGSPEWTVPTRAVCPGSYTIPPIEAGPLEDPELVETSGLAASLLNPGVLWAHNDSGDGPRLFALGTDGRALGQVELEGAVLVDAEDIAAAACPDLSGPCLYLADTGDNALAASEVSLYILPEPLVDPVTGVAVSSTTDWQRIRFTYAGGPVDVEALAVEPDGSRVYLFEKLHADSVRLFTLDAPFSEQGVATATVATTFAPPGLAFVNYGRSITAADLHLSGTRLLVRVYSGIFEYRFGAGQGLVDLAAVEPALVTLGPLSEPQGEALAYDETGRELFSVSEDTGQMPGLPLHRFACP